MDEIRNVADTLCDFIMVHHGCGECPLRSEDGSDKPCEKYQTYERELGETVWWEED